MILHPQDIWDEVMNDFLDHAIPTALLDRYDGTGSTMSSLESCRKRPIPFKKNSTDSTTSSDSKGLSISNIATTPSLDTPIADQADCLSGLMQMIWSTEAQDFVQPRPVMSDQHHEKACLRCSLTPTEARKCRLDRRREQNRESQRKFRARKDAKIRDAAGHAAALESYIEFLQGHNNDLEGLNAQLQQRIGELESERQLHTMHLDMPDYHGNHMESLETWRLTTTADTSSLVQEPNLVQVNVSHHRLLDHELLLPHGSRARGG